VTTEVAAGVIRDVRAFRMTPESRSSAVVVSQERRHPVCGGLPSQNKQRGLGVSRLCSWVHSIAEVDERHVARELR
jgi:hypothetical protein